MDPLRTCVACREKVSRSSLLRVVFHEGQVLPDDRAILPGRGAWVHPTDECLKQAIARRSFLRALKVPGSPDTSPLENRLEKLMDK